MTCGGHGQWRDMTYSPTANCRSPTSMPLEAWVRYVCWHGNLQERDCTTHLAVSLIKLSLPPDTDAECILSDDMGVARVARVVEMWMSRWSVALYVSPSAMQKASCNPHRNEFIGTGKWLRYKRYFVQSGEVIRVIAMWEHEKPWTKRYFK